MPSDLKTAIAEVEKLVALGDGCRTPSGKLWECCDYDFNPDSSWHFDFEDGEDSSLLTEREAEYLRMSLLVRDHLRTLIDAVKELQNENMMHRSMQSHREGRSKPVGEIIASLEDKVSDSLNSKND